MGRSQILGTQGCSGLHAISPLGLGPPPCAPWITAPYVLPGTCKKHLRTTIAKGWGSVWASISCLGKVSNEINAFSLHHNNFFVRWKKKGRRAVRSFAQRSSPRGRRPLACSPQPCLLPPGACGTAVRALGAQEVLGSLLCGPPWKTLSKLHLSALGLRCLACLGPCLWPADPGVGPPHEQMWTTGFASACKLPLFPGERQL